MLCINLFAQVKFANLNGVLVRLFNEIMNDISVKDNFWKITNRNFPHRFQSIFFNNSMIILHSHLSSITTCKCKPYIKMYFFLHLKQPVPIFKNKFKVLIMNF